MLLEVAGKRRREGLETREPLHAGHAVPARHNQTGWRPVIHREWDTGHMRGHNRVGVQRIGNGQRAGKGDEPGGVIPWAGVGAVANPFHHIRRRVHAREERAERHARPGRRAHRPIAPRFARGDRIHAKAAIAGALHGDRDVPLRQGGEVRHRHRHGRLHRPPDMDKMGRIKQRRREITADIHAGRRGQRPRQPPRRRLRTQRGLANHIQCSGTGGISQRIVGHGESSGGKPSVRTLYPQLSGGGGKPRGVCRRRRLVRPRVRRFAPV